jgi:hypothetical protein
MEKQDLILNIFCASAVAERDGYVDTSAALSGMLIVLVSFKISDDEGNPIVQNLGT